MARSQEAMKAGATFLVLLAAASAAGCAPQPAPIEAAATDARLAHALVQKKCSTCHTLEVALSGRRNAAQWAEILEAMVGHGMVATDPELRAMQDYLAKNH